MNKNFTEISGWKERMLGETQPHLKSKHVNFLAFSEAFCTESVLSSEISSIHTLINSFIQHTPNAEEPGLSLGLTTY